MIEHSPATLALPHILNPRNPQNQLSGANTPLPPRGFPTLRVLWMNLTPITSSAVLLLSWVGLPGTTLKFRLPLFQSFLAVANVRIPYPVLRNALGLTSSCHFSLYMSRLPTPANPPESHQIDPFM
jgi:hypothetical protein